MMKRKIIFVLACLAAVSCSHAPAASELDPVDHVSVLVGTMSKHSLSTGNTYPAIARPWGMNFWTPQTGTMGDGWTYCYTADKIRGFKQTHQPSPWINDYGQFAVMPVTGEAVFSQDERASWFSHKAEDARPYYYGVYLADHDVYVELTPTERAAAFRITYPEDESPYLVVDAFDNGSYVKVIPEENRIIGYTTKNSGGVPSNFRNWFVIESDAPFDYVRTVRDGVDQSAAMESESAHSGAIVGFRLDEDRSVNLKVASSFISVDQALVNMEELGDGDFDRLKAEGRARWNEVLGRIQVGGGTEEQYRTFYSCLYRSTLFPRKFYEIDAQGKPVHYSPYNGQVCDGHLYTDTGFWDTFRALFPLLNLVYPSVNREIQQGLANISRENDFLPEWSSPGHRDCMVGNNSASVVVDAILKGVTPEEDWQVLYDCIVHGTENVHPQVSSSGRIGHEYYNTIGYIPYNVGINENVARTLEYAYDDWCILQLARKMGRPEDELRKWEARSGNWRNVFDPSHNLMRGRNADGTFQEPFSPYKWGGAFTEGNAWHYTWSVFHDVDGLIEAMGGKDLFAGMLDSVFVVPPVFDASYYGYRIHEITEMQVADMGNYAHGNQPAQHMIYLYNWAGQPWKTQKHVREVMDRLYNAAPDGYCGDEDNGQTSAWYVFSALGFYPVCPCSDEYAVGSPYFRKAVVHLENGKDLVINAKENSSDHPFVSSLKLNGRRRSPDFVSHSALCEGAVLDFAMTAALP